MLFLDKAVSRENPVPIEIVKIVSATGMTVPIPVKIIAVETNEPLPVTIQSPAVVSIDNLPEPEPFPTTIEVSNFPPPLTEIDIGNFPLPIDLALVESRLLVIADWLASKDDLRARQFLRNTQTEPGAGGVNPGGVFDLSGIPGVAATLLSGNTNIVAFSIGARFQRTIRSLYDPSSVFAVSVNMASLSNVGMEWQAKVQRLNAYGVVLAESAPLGPFNTAGIKTGNLTLAAVWAPSDRVALTIEYRSTTAGQNRTFTLNVNHLLTFIDIA